MPVKQKVSKMFTPEQWQTVEQAICSTWSELASDAQELYDGKCVPDGGAMELCLDAGRLLDCGPTGVQAEAILEPLYKQHGWKKVKAECMRMYGRFDS